MNLEQKIQWLLAKLLPPGRAFRTPEGGILYRLFRALNVVLSQAYTDGQQLLNNIIPDNPNFTEDDAHDWYRRLGIYDSGSVPFADMKLAIAQKQSFPLTPLDKQSLDYIEEQLQAAGFDVHVYMNRFPDGGGGWMTKSPGEILGPNNADGNLGGFNLGEANLGSSLPANVSLLVNYLEEEKDALFLFGENMRFTFYISDATVDTFANVLASRKIEFRQLVSKLKAQNMAAILFVNYI